MKGYYRKPEETARAIDAEGWLHTGDAGVLRADGRLEFLYRLSEGYKTNGFNVAPAEIEAALRRHPEVADVAVFGRRDPVAGEVGVACVIARDGSRPSADALLEFLRPHLAAYKMPRHLVFVDALPMTAGTGKVQKFRLRDAIEPLLPNVELRA
jgi:acyl-CoA synthetase (AMP-forming)/AMP-acid ligase II